MNWLEWCGVGFAFTWFSLIGVAFGCISTDPEAKYPPLWKTVVCGPFMWLLVFVVYLQYRKEKKRGT